MKTAANRLVKLITGRDVNATLTALDSEIQFNQGVIRNNVQAVASGTRVLDTMSGAMKMLSEEKR